MNFSEPKLRLPDVSLVCIDTNTPELGLRAVLRSLKVAEFGEVLFFTSPRAQNFVANRIGRDARVIEVSIDSNAAYNKFVLFDLVRYVEKSHVMIVQWDGFILEATHWDEKFLASDYIGAPWRINRRGRFLVGNGGFSIRSKRLMKLVCEHCRQPNEAVLEDEFICKTNRALLVRHGAIFSPPGLARRFSFESQGSIRRTFGFHGFQSLSRLIDDEHLNLVIEQLGVSSCKLDSFSGFFDGAYERLSDGQRRRLLALVEEYYFTSEATSAPLPYRSLVKVLAKRGVHPLARRLLAKRIDALGFDGKNLRLWIFYLFMRVFFIWPRSSYRA